MMKNILWSIQHLNSVMAGSRKLCKSKNYCNHISRNELFVTVYFMVLIFPTYGTSEVESNNSTCSDLMSCTECTIKPMCEWSLKQQACENENTFLWSNLIVSTIDKCPQFSVFKKHDYGIDGENFSEINVDYIVEIKNDLVNFVDYLENLYVYCVSLNGGQMRAEIIDKTIFCKFVKPKSKFNVNETTVTHFIYIKFNKIILRFNNVADHYVTVYKSEECVNEDTYKNCATCGWNKNGYFNYLKWCPSEDTCKYHRNIYMKNNVTDRLNESIAYVTNDCPEINVTTVDPMSGPQTGGTTVTIKVTNHRIFMENRTLKITVAGTVCTHPKTSGLETITCITSEVVGNLSGPVLVEYSSTEGVLKIESSQVFKFYQNPVLDADQQLGEATMIGRTSTHPDDPSKLPAWFLMIIAISSVLVFVFLFAYSLTKKYWYDVTRSISNSLGTSTSVQDLLNKHTEL